MALSFTALATVAVIVFALSTAITYVTVLYLRLPFAGVLAAMVVVGVLNAILRTAALSNFEEVTGASVKHPAFALDGVTADETTFLFVTYLAVGIAQLLILQSRFTLRERWMIVSVTGISNVLFRNLL